MLIKHKDRVREKFRASIGQGIKLANKESLAGFVNVLERKFMSQVEDARLKKHQRKMYYKIESGKDHTYADKIEKIDIGIENNYTLKILFYEELIKELKEKFPEISQELIEKIEKRKLGISDKKEKIVKERVEKHLF